jgi:outer membrane protein assembly factor BamB
MKNTMTCLILMLVFQHAAQADMAELQQSSGVSGGVILHLGCGDGKQTAALRVNDRFLVHGLDTDPENIEKARVHIQSLGLYGRVSVDIFNGSHLPLIDSMVNLLIADQLGSVSRSEVMRVLVPEGVAIIAGQKIVKPRPEEIDEWTHYLHDADNNAVAQDTRVGPPRHVQWQAEPKWPRHHDKMSSVSALVSTHGRIFYIIDEGSTASIYMPSHWALIARDAFNGKLLWKKPIKTWFSQFKGLKDGPADAPRRLVASGDRVYVTLDLDGRLSAVDAVSGETVCEYAGTNGTEEILLSNGVLFVLMGPHSLGDGARKLRPTELRSIKALNAESGEILWQARAVVAALTMAVDSQRLYYFNFKQKRVFGLNRHTGQEEWASNVLPAPAQQTSFFASKLVVHDDVVLFASGEFSGMTKSGGGETRSDTLTALSASTGKTIWTDKHPPSGYSSPENLFVIDNTVWCDSSSNGRLDGTVIGYDLHSGKVKRRFPEDQSNYWFHHRCYAGRATSKYIMTSRTGIEFIDLQKEQWDLNHWIRGTCLYGIMPCNGLVYTPPAPCACYAETYLHSFNALAPKRRGNGEERRVKNEDRLEKGPAYLTEFHPSQFTLHNSNDWPTYRADNARRGYVKTSIRADLKPAWEAELGGKLSSVTIAQGKVFVAAVERHTVYALASDTGKQLWQFTAGGRVDSPPSYYEGRVLFGSADGWVYCVRATDGALIWRFMGALADQRIVSYEQVESLWPIHGSIMIQNDMAHFVAGRSIFVDGGMRLYRINAKTGALISETVLDDRNPQTGNDIQELVKWLNMPVGRPDILSSDGQRIYMRSQAFDLQGKRLRMGPRLNKPQEGQLQGGPETHLFCPTGYLDDTWFHRTYWLYGSTWGSGWNGYFVAGKYAPAGKIMSVGDDQVYVFGRQAQYYKWTTPMEFRLFAAHKQWKALPPKSRAVPAKNKNKRKQDPGPVTNTQNYLWSKQVPILARAMVLADKTLFIAGPRDLLKEGPKAMQQEAIILKQEAALAGQSGAMLRAVSAQSGETLSEYTLDSPPVFDGMAAANGCLFLSTVGGKVFCLH